MALRTIKRQRRSKSKKARKRNKNRESGSDVTRSLGRGRVSETGGLIIRTSSVNTGTHRLIPNSENRSTLEIGKHLRSIPFSPRGNNMVNLVSSNRPDLSKATVHVYGSHASPAYPYPDGFTKVIFPSIDGTPLMGTLGLHRDGIKRPGAVFCHGFHGSRNKNYIMEATVKAYEEWGYNVLALDLRNFGESQKISNSPSTGGWKEGQDVLGACRFLGAKDNVTTVAAVGYSLGASSVINAAYQCGKYPFITGGALAWSGYASVETMISRINSRPPLADPFFPIYTFLLCLTEMRRLEIMRKMDKEEADVYLSDKPFAPDYGRYFREIAAPYYGLSEEEIHLLSSPKEFISEVDIPLMLIHAQDDPVCPAEEVEELRGAADHNPDVDIWILPTGSHCAFQGFDREWYWAVMRDYLDYWAEGPVYADLRETV